MRKNIKYYSVVLYWFLQFSAGAQNTGIYQPNLNETSNSLEGKLIGEIYYFTPVANSNFFLQQEWDYATITLKNGDVFNDVRMRLNIKDNELVTYNKNNRQLFVVDRKSVEKFEIQPSIINNKSFVQTFINVDSARFSQERYFELLYKGSAGLLMFHEIVEKKVVPFSDENGHLHDTEYIKKAGGYIQSPQFGLKRIKLSNRALAAFYEDDKKEIKRTLRKNNINIIGRESAVAAFSVLDEAGLLK